MSLLSDLHRYLSDPDGIREFDDGADGLWNAAGRIPRVRVEVASEADVARTLRVAGDHGIAVTVWGGRYDVFGRNAGVGEIVIDLRRHRGVRINRDTDTVVVEGGTTVGDVLEHLPSDSVTVLASNPQLGMIGAAAGGGYGPLLPRYGLMADQLVEARVVLADGSIRKASPTGDTELLWGLRGGGSGFGVVMSARFRTHRLAEVTHTVVAVPLTEAAHALHQTQALLDAHEDDLSLLPLFTTGPDGERVLIISGHWSADMTTGAEVAGRLTSLTQVTVVNSERTNYAATVGGGEDELWPTGKHWVGGSRTVARLDDEAIETLVDSAHRMPGPASRLFAHDFHGAAVRAADDSAFELRQNHFVVAAFGYGEVGDADSVREQQTWTESVNENLDAFAMQGGYVNFLNPEEADRTVDAFPKHADRLADLKRHLDPEARFSGTTGLRIRA